MKDVSEYSPLVLEAWAVHEVMFRLGFTGDDTFFVHGRSARHGGVLSLFIQLRKDGKEFTVEIGESPDPSALEAEWLEFITKGVNEGGFSEDTLHEIFEKSRIVQAGPMLIQWIEDQGIPVPNWRRHQRETLN